MITSQDLIDRFGETELAKLTDRQSYQVIDVAVINRAISDAESEVSTYLRSAGLVGIDTLGNVIYLKAPKVPDALVLKTCDVARYYLYENGTTGIVEKRYDDAIKWLDKVKKDPTMLTGPIAEQPTASGGISVIPNPVPNIYQD